MKIGFFEFYKLCLKRAFFGWFKRVEGWASTASLLVATALFVFSHSPGIEKIATAIPTVFFLLVFFGGVLHRLILAPYRLWREEYEARLILERRRRATLSPRLPEPSVLPSVSNRGRTSETVGGNRITAITGWRMDVVALVCTNIGETTAHKCRARILSATRLDPNASKPLKIVESVQLSWNKENPETNLETDIPPNDTKYIYIGGVRGSGHIWLYRDIARLPIEYQQILGEAGTYRILVQVDGDDIPSQQVTLEIKTEAGVREGAGILRGKAEAAIIDTSEPRFGR